MSGARTRTVLESLATQTVAHRTLVVDNASPDEAVSRACGDFEFAKPIRSDVNLGFSRAVNRAGPDG